VTRATPIPDTVTLHIPFRVPKRGGRKEMQLPSDIRARPRPDDALIKALARAFRWKRMLESDEFSTIAELAGREAIPSTYMARLLRLTLLAPDIVEAILDGRQGPEVTLARMLEPLPMDIAASCPTSGARSPKPVHDSRGPAMPRRFCTTRCAGAHRAALNAAQARARNDHGHACSQLERLEQAAVSAADDPLSAEGSARLMAQLMGMMRTQLVDAHEVVMGERDWTGSQARIFTALLDKILPDPPATNEVRHRLPDGFTPLSRVELEAIASGRA
jgi:hypothetical protein